MFAPNLICVCVDYIKNADYGGNIFHAYTDEPIEFRDSKELLMKMDHFYDDWNFPQASTHPRTFNGDFRCVVQGKQGEGLKMERIQDKHGEQGTFIVHVMYRQNSSWQGDVVWVDQNKKKYFRSALELLKLIGSAIEDPEEEIQISSWDLEGNEDNNDN